MMYILSLKNYGKIVDNHYLLKCLITNNYSKNRLIKIIISLNWKSIVSFKIKEVIESLFYFKILTNQKSYISYYKKKYKECDLIIKVDLLKNKTNYLLFLWILFYFPTLQRREIFFTKKKSSRNNIMFSCNLYNIYPYMSDIYFSWVYKVVYTLLFTDTNVNNNYLILSYYNYPRK